MSGRRTYTGGGNGGRIQNSYQSQRNYNHCNDPNAGMKEQQDSDPQQTHRNEQPAPQAPGESQFSCRVIQPDPAKREKILTMARKEEEEYQRFKESRRSGPIQLTPRKLGGQTSELEARQQQQWAQAQSKYQKMIQREENRKKQKEEEEAKIQEMKNIQRKKAEKLEEKRQQQDLERKQRWHEDRCIRNNEFLDRLQPLSHPYNRRFGQPSEWEKNQAIDQERNMKKTREINSEDESPYRNQAIEQQWNMEKMTEIYSEEEQPHGSVNQEEDEDLMFQQALKESLLTNQAIEQQWNTEKMTEIYSEEEQPHGSVNQEEDEDLMFQQALKESLLTHKIEEETRLQKMKTPQNKQPRQQTYRQQQKEEEERKLKHMKDEQHKKAEVLKQHEEERRLSQDEERRRVNKAFLDRLQGSNSSKPGYSGEFNTWA